VCRTNCQTSPQANAPGQALPQERRGWCIRSSRGGAAPADQGPRHAERRAKGICSMTAKLILEPGTEFGHLTVLCEAPKGRTPGGQTYSQWECICKCGQTTVSKLGNLRNGHTTSCGCGSSRFDLPINNTVHGQCRKGQVTKCYRSWAHMHERCYNPQMKGYKYWGARGITVCKRWHTFKNFYADMGDPPPGKTLDRKNNEKGYYKRNCRWATPGEQSANRRGLSYVLIERRRMYVAEACRILGISRNKLWV
jgi:hypothetical protein